MNIDPTIFEQEDIFDIFADIADYIYEEFSETPFDELDEKTQNLIVLVGLDDAVEEGGFVQFVENNSGDFFMETLAAAEALNYEPLVEALDKVQGQFPNKLVPTETEERQELLEKLITENDRAVPFLELDKETQAELLANHDNSFPIEECAFAIEESEWTKVWEEVDAWYDENVETIYQKIIDYAKSAK